MKRKLDGVMLINGVLGIATLLAFVGIMVWWVKALPLITIFVLVICLLIYDFVRTLKYGEEGTR